MVFSEKCHICGTKGKLWHKDPEVWQCPNCYTIFSRFGVVLETENEPEDFWS